MVNPDKQHAALWFTRAELLKGIENDSLTLPPKHTIACHLIEDWVPKSGWEAA